MSSAEGPRGRRAGAVVTSLLVGLGIVAVMVLAATGTSARPFAVGSTAPDGYRALGIVLEDEGVRVRSVAADDPVIGVAGAATVLYVPEPRRATAEDLTALLEAARRGATVIHGSPPPSWSEVGGDDEDVSGDRDVPAGAVDHVDPTLLVDGPAVVVDRRVCDVEALEDLGPIDTVVGEWVHLPLAQGPATPPDAHVTGSCYGSADAAQFVELGVGDGHVYVISSPYLWTNAALKRTDPNTGTSLDNGLTAWRSIMGDGSRPRPAELLVVDSTAPGTGGPEGGSDLLSLLPPPFKAFGSVLLLALVAFVWNHATRFGAPVVESAPVEVEASEFTAAVGRLFMDDAVFLERGAEAMRDRARHDLAAAVGLGADVEPVVLCTAVGVRSNRDVSDVSEVLYGTQGVTTLAGVLELEGRIERLRAEVADAGKT